LQKHPLRPAAIGSSGNAHGDGTDSTPAAKP
jgi:hypothetical protein